MAHDPITAETTRVADHREPVFVHAEQVDGGATAKLAALEAAHRPQAQRPDRPHGRRRLGRLRLLRRRRRWPARRRPNIDRLARDGPAAHVVLLRAVVHAVAGVAHDRPAADAPRPAASRRCTASRAGSGRGHARPAALATPATSPRPSASGTWARTSSRSPRTSASTTSTASSASRTCTPSGATRTSSPRSSTARSARDWVENEPFNKCFVHATRGGEPENVEEVTIPVLSTLDDKWAAYSVDFIAAWRGGDQPWFLYHCTRGAHFDNYPHERFLGIVAGQAPVQGHDRRARRHRRPPRGRRSRRRASSRTRSCSSRPTTGPRWRRGPTPPTRRSAAPRARPGRAACGCPAIFSWPGMIEPAGVVRRPVRPARPVRHRAARSPAPTTRCPTTATSTASTRRRSCSRPTGESNRKFHYYWLHADVLGAAGRRVQVHDRVDLRRRPRRRQPRRVHRRRCRSTPTGGSSTCTSIRRRRTAT